MKLKFSRIGEIGHLIQMLLVVHKKTLSFQKYSTSSTKWTLQSRNNKYELLRKKNILTVWEAASCFCNQF